MINLRFIRRELSSSPQQAIIFVLCVALSIVTLVSLSGFSESVDRSLLRDAKVLHAADIIIESNYELSPPLIESINLLKQKKEVEVAKIYEFYSVVRSPEKEESLLADIKVAEPEYPFYGQVELLSRKPFSDRLVKGGVIVEQGLLDRMRLSVGDRLKIGNAILTIRDVFLKEPDRPVNFFSLGPRIFISSDDLDELGLIKKGSRVHYKALLKVNNEAEIDRITAGLRSRAVKDQERVETFRSAESGVKRFFDNFLFFLNLIGIFTLLLAGIGIQSTLTALLREKEKTIAVMKALGGTRRFITTHFSTIVAIFGLIGTLMGLLASLLLQGIFPLLFGGIIPGNVEFHISLSAVFQEIALGMAVVALFTFLPLYRLEDVKPGSILGRQEIKVKRGLPYYLSIAATFIFSVGMVFFRVRDAKTGLYFVSGIISLIIVITITTELAVLLIQRARVKGLILRQAVRGLLRPGNATRAVMITMTASLSVISSIYLIELNLDADFIKSYPEDAPNLFFVDIQPSQKDDFSKALGIRAEYYPVVRARISSINGESVNVDEEQRRMRDNLGREFNLTYRGHLLPDEAVVKGKSLFRKDWSGVQVSVLDTVLKMKKMNVGDLITFNIQGVPVDGRISSIRTRTKTSIQPFFYFVFPEDALKDAPQTIFTAVRAKKGEIPKIQNRIASIFPNVSVIDMTEVVSLFSRVMGRLSVIARFFTIFSVIAGVLIIISSAFATRYARIQEAVYFKILGAKGSFILKLFTVESLLIGLISALLAIVYSQVVSWIVCMKILDVSHALFIGPSLLMVLITIILVTITGMLASVSILKQRPVAFLREETKE